MELRVEESGIALVLAVSARVNAAMHDGTSSQQATMPVCNSVLSLSFWGYPG